ncbi:MAG: hypothetical protein DRI57_12595 [Deltaproteobacteria bacterium]|nr:MAG: hypothetical protein DRI57_12595 [Deltaproteobacteria bacterium]
MAESSVSTQKCFVKSYVSDEFDMCEKLRDSAAKLAFVNMGFRYVVTEETPYMESAATGLSAIIDEICETMIEISSRI